MVLHKLERRKYGGKFLVSIKYQNCHSFKEVLILLCQSILETRRITHLHGSAHFTISLTWKDTLCDKLLSEGFNILGSTVLCKTQFGQISIHCTNKSICYVITVLEATPLTLSVQITLSV